MATPKQEQQQLVMGLGDPVMDICVNCSPGEAMG